MTTNTSINPAASAATPTKTPRAWSPPVDVVESGNEFLLRLDIPGVPDDAVSIVMDRGRLTVSGAREAAATGETGGRTHLAERHAGNFERVFRLSSAVDEEKIEARLERGVLTIRVPKADTRRTITIQ